MNEEEREERAEWSGAIAFVLSIGVSTVLVILALGVVFGEADLGEGARETYAGILGALVGSIATYIGLRTERK